MKPETVDIWNLTVILMRSTNIPNGSYSGSTVNGMRTDTSTDAANLGNTAVDFKNSAIIKAVIMIFFAVVGLIGNGISLATIKRTPKLRTKTYSLLASLISSDLLTGLFVFWVTTYQMVAYVFSTNPCSHIMLVAILTCPQKIPLGATITHVSLISVERFIAVVHPLRYETLVTDTTIKGMIAIGWVLPTCLSLFYLTYISRIDWNTCTIRASLLQSAIMDVCYILASFTVIICLYGCILVTALHQRAKINSEVSKQSQQVSGEQPTAVKAIKKLRLELKAVRLTASIVGAFVVLWTPYVIGRIIQASGITSLFGQYLTDIGSALGAAYSSTNWIIFGLACRDFRMGIVTTLLYQSH